MILVIAEKHSVGREIAKVIGADKKEQGCYTGGGYIVSWCIGHLVRLAFPEEYDTALTNWKIDTLPIIPETFKTKLSNEKNAATQYKILVELMNRKDVTELICATDAGREGELIFRLIYELAACKKPFKRLWISSLEEKTIRDGMAALKNGREYDNLYCAAQCRQRADWLLGINLTRFYSVLYHKKLNTGRVQTPTINLIVKRQAAISNFVPATYYSLIADMDGFKAYSKATDKAAADSIVERCKGKLAHVTQVQQEEKKDTSPPLYDLTSLQREANRFVCFTAQQTLDAAQSLYEAKLATYPRTDSRYITADMVNSITGLMDGLMEKNCWITNS